MTQPHLLLQRVRIQYARHEASRYISHLDMMRVWERSLRRARLPLAYSQGFSPQPRMHLACSLPVGFLSRCELIDFWLEKALPLSEIFSRLKAALPPGLEISRMDEISLSQPPLQTQVKSAQFVATLLECPEGLDIASAVDNLLSATALPRERRNKPYDLRPLIFSLEVLHTDSAHKQLLMHISARESATARPEEVLAALGLDPLAAKVERINLFLE